MNVLPPFAGFMNFTPALPQFYWDVYSAEERVKRICMELHKLVDYCDAMNVNININADDIDALQAEFEKFKEHGFEDYYAAQFDKWFRENIKSIYNDLTSMVYFGLTDDGHFCAYVPDSWRDISFDTGMVFGEADYGRLILRWDVDGTEPKTINR